MDVVGVLWLSRNALKCSRRNRRLRRIEGSGRSRPGASPRKGVTPGIRQETTGVAERAAGREEIGEDRRWGYFFELRELSLRA